MRECYEGNNERESELRVAGWESILCEITKNMVHEEIILCGKRGYEKKNEGQSSRKKKVRERKSEREKE